MRPGASTRARGHSVFQTSGFDGPPARCRGGERFPPLILAGPHDDDLVCLEGNLRLTAHGLAGFPTETECLVGTAPALERWAQ
jgi:hypothetical protein